MTIETHAAHSANCAANRSLYQPHFLVHALSTDVDRRVLTFGEISLSADEFRQMVSRYSQALAEMGLQPGDRVAVLSANRPEVLYLTAACLINRYVLVPMHPLGSLQDHVFVLADAGATHLVFDPRRFAQRAEQVARECGGIRLLSFGASAVGLDLSTASARMRPAPLVAPDVSGDDVYRYSYTGGTTGRPKAIAATHRMALALLNAQLADWEWPGQLRQLMCAPLSHAGAAMFMPTLLRGGELVVLPQFDPVIVMKTIESQRITCVLLVPTMIYALLDHPRFRDFDLSSLQTVFYGASAMSPVRLREAIEALGPIFFQFYGQAEAPMTISVLRRGEHIANDYRRLSSCGRPVHGVRVALLNDDGEEVHRGELGEICARGPLVMPGYHNRPEETRDALRGGWLHTGDIATCETDGFLRIVDRKKDLIISGGFNVYPKEIEDVLAMHPAVAMSAVIGVRHARWGEAVKAIVVLRSGESASTEELIAFVRERKGPHHAPKSVAFVDDLPLTAVGKPDKRTLRAQFGAGPP
jgi:fatty-acyl-CoA synthase